MAEQAKAGDSGALVNTTGQGVIYTLISMFCFSLMDVLIKHLGGDYSVMQILFFRCAAAFIPILFLLYRAGGIKILKTERPGAHFMRAVFGMTAMYCVFSAMIMLPLADAVTIIFSAPLAMTALSVPLLGERVGIHRWSAVIIGFIGVLVIVNPGGGVFQVGAIYAIAAALCMAMAMITVRKLSSTEHTVCITFYFTLAGVIVGIIGLAFTGWVQPSLEDFFMLIMVGVLGGVAQFFMTQGFRLAEVAIVAPLEYSQMIFVALLAYFIFGEIPDTRLWIGAAIIVCSGLYMVHRETRWKGIRPRKLPKLRGRSS